MQWINQQILDQLGQDAGYDLLPQLIDLFIADGELTLQQSEVEAVLMMSEQEIEQRAAEFTPDSIAALHIWQQRRERGS